MSEYQYVSFRAIDKPVGAENLEYMERQSSSAEITPWSFDNEYHYGDFGGNASVTISTSTTRISGLASCSSGFRTACPLPARSSPISPRVRCNF